MKQGIVRIFLLCLFLGSCTQLSVRAADGSRLFQRFQSQLAAKQSEQAATLDEYVGLFEQFLDNREIQESEFIKAFHFFISETSQALHERELKISRAHLKEQDKAKKLLETEKTLLIATRNMLTRKQTQYSEQRRKAAQEKDFIQEAYLDVLTDRTLVALKIIDEKLKEASKRLASYLPWYGRYKKQFLIAGVAAVLTVGAVLGYQEWKRRQEEQGNGNGGPGPGGANDQVVNEIVRGWNAFSPQERQARMLSLAGDPQRQQLVLQNLTQQQRSEYEAQFGAVHPAQQGDISLEEIVAALDTLGSVDEINAQIATFSPDVQRQIRRKMPHIPAPDGQPQPASTPQQYTVPLTAVHIAQGEAGTDFVLGLWNGIPVSERQHYMARLSATQRTQVNRALEFVRSRGLINRDGTPGIGIYLGVKNEVIKRAQRARTVAEKVAFAKPYVYDTFRSFYPHNVLTRFFQEHGNKSVDVQMDEFFKISSTDFSALTTIQVSADEDLPRLKYVELTDKISRVRQLVDSSDSFDRVKAYYEGENIPEFDKQVLSVVARYAWTIKTGERVVDDARVVGVAKERAIFDHLLGQRLFGEIMQEAHRAVRDAQARREQEAQAELQRREAEQEARRAEAEALRLQEHEEGRRRALELAEQRRRAEAERQEQLRAEQEAAAAAAEQSEREAALEQQRLEQERQRGEQGQLSLQELHAHRLAEQRRQERLQPQEQVGDDDDEGSDDDSYYSDSEEDDDNDYEWGAGGHTLRDS